MAKRKATESSKRKSATKARVKSVSGARKRVPSIAAQLPKTTRAQRTAEAKRFSSSVLARGEAVPAGTPLSAGATHIIIGRDADGAPLLERKRFSTF